MLPIFDFMQKEGDIALEEMYKTFNMSIGFILVVKPEDQEKTLAALQAINEEGYVMGAVTSDHEGVALCK